MNMNYQQAPQIKNGGEKFQQDRGMGKAIRNHSLEEAIANGLGERDFAAYKVMMFLTGNAEGFAVAEKTICERCNISETSYKNARKKLAAMGWITHKQGKEIVINYDVIYKGCVSQNGTNFSQKEKNQGYIDNTPQVKEKNQGYIDNTPQGYIDNTPQGYIENTHNNIRNKIKDTIITAKDKTDIGATPLNQILSFVETSQEEEEVEESQEEEEIEKLPPMTRDTIRTAPVEVVWMNDKVVYIPNSDKKFRVVG